ncbi:hypothetical protein CC86DRAFT_11848 [Ophiobolus disseminans]|uniref:Uncharacterized protein n=1 Tax=Ophiobolus disseminans TaxID=1469910 RepID=A0A6A7AK38_9PLEO|nr:hypothetical protein CC86DRAFT_11848 [Ophiobolus disseminans]
MRRLHGCTRMFGLLRDAYSTRSVVRTRQPTQVVRSCDVRYSAIIFLLSAAGTTASRQPPASRQPAASQLTSDSSFQIHFSKVAECVC